MSDESKDNGANGASTASNAALVKTSGASIAPPQKKEADESVNSTSAEPKVKGKDARPPCIGCGGGPHPGERKYVLCLEVEIARLRSLLEQTRGHGLCATPCCQRKAVVCKDCAKGERANPPLPKASKR
jgi:hypothetical protein